MRIQWRESFHYDRKMFVEEQYSPFYIPQETLKAKFMQQYCEEADRQGVLGNARITNTCGYINIT